MKKVLSYTYDLIQHIKNLLAPKLIRSFDVVPIRFESNTIINQYVKDIISK